MKALIFGVLLHMCSQPFQHEFLHDHLSTDDHETNYKFINAHWYNGEKFVKKTMYSSNGTFLEKSPGRIDSTFDLRDKFIIPPLSESHVHMLDGFGDYKQVIKNYLKQGIFYVKNPNNIRPWTENLYEHINKINSLDATFANGGLTCTGGHPETLYEDRIRHHLGGAMKDTPRGWFKNKSYFTIDTMQDFDQQWELIKSGNPDFIKVYLANAEDIGKPSPTTKYELRKGLDPAIVPGIVEQAHADGYRVSAHVETRYDFELAIKAGVDEITHTPGFYLFSKDHIERYKLTDEDAKLAAENDVYVVTALMSRNLTEDHELMPLVKETQAYNLAMLEKYNVKIVIGSDHAMTPFDEVKAIRELNVFDNKTLLKYWCEVTPQTIFPDRKIGFLKAGYEASFVALNANPIEDWNNLSSSSLLFKQGHVLTVD